MRIATHLVGLLACSLHAYVAVAQGAENLGFEAGQPGKIPSGWSVPTPGWAVELTTDKAAEGSMSAKLHLPQTSTAPFGNLMRRFDATEYRGRRVVLRAKLLVEGKGRAQMWLRVDRDDGRMGAFDNMDRRAIFAGGWKDAVIEAEIDHDAKALNIGFMSIDGATVFIDAVALTLSAEATTEPQATSPARALSPRELENLIAATRLLSYVRFFHPSDQAAGVMDWDHFAIFLLESVEPSTDPVDLAKRLTHALASIAPTLQIWAGSPDEAPPPIARPAEATSFVSWKHLGAGRIGSELPHNVYASKIERNVIADGLTDPAGMYAVKALGGGVSCRLPVKVYADATGTLPHGKTPEDWTNSAGKPKLDALNRSTRLAGVALGWGIFQHFYPYFEVVGTDWDSVLAAGLKKAAEDGDEVSYLRTLWAMTAQLHDGHANVSNRAMRTSTFLPLSLEWAGPDLVVVGTHAIAADAVKRGDVVTSIDGKSADECYRQVSEWISAATDGWRRRQSIDRIMINLPTPDPVRFTLRRPDGSTYSTTLRRVKEWPANTTAQRPKNGAELAPGIVYFNLDQATTGDLDRAMTKLERARGIVFDMRGYPGDAGIELMQHLIDAPATSQRWILPIFRRPDREGMQWFESERWTLVPKAPRLTGKVAFLTDGRAISYAESIMGIVEHYKFGEIVGSSTAGTNGNVNPFTLPGGFSVSFTGMIVLKHDGSRHHGVGIAPTVPVTPTAAGIAAGKDEVLEEAIEVLKSKLDAGGSSP